MVLFLSILLVTTFKFRRQDTYFDEIKAKYSPIHFNDSINGIVEEVFTPEGLRYNYTSCYLRLSGKNIYLITSLNENDSCKFRYTIDKGDFMKKQKNSLNIYLIKAGFTEIMQFELDTTNTQVW